MKYPLQNDPFVTETYHVETRFVAAEVLLRIFNSLMLAAKYIGVVSLKFLLGVERHYSSNEFYTVNRKKLEKYESASKWHVPNRLWDRHSALLCEARELPGAGDVHSHSEK